LSSINIPSTVTSIGKAAFNNNNLTTVSIPKGVTVIRHSAFRNNNLTSITLQEGIKVIEEGSFCNNKLTSVTIPSSVTKIGENAFADNSLTSITIPENVAEVDRFAFRNNSLTSVVIMSNLKTLEENVFANNSGLTSIRFPANFTLKLLGNEGFPPSLYSMLNAYEYLAGTYEYKNNAWYLNGKILPKPVQIVCGLGVTITVIEGVYVHLEKGSPVSRQVIPQDGRSDVFLAPGFYRITVAYEGGGQARGKQASGGKPETYEYAQDFVSGLYELSAASQGNQVDFRISDPR